MKAPEKLLQLVEISEKVAKLLSNEVMKLNLANDEDYMAMMGCFGLAAASIISSAVKRSTLTKGQLIARMMLMANEFANEDL